MQLALRVMQKVRWAPNVKVVMLDLESLVEPNGSEFLNEVPCYRLEANTHIDVQELATGCAKRSQTLQDKLHE